MRGTTKMEGGTWQMGKVGHRCAIKAKCRQKQIRRMLSATKPLPKANVGRLGVKSMRERAKNRAPGEPAEGIKATLSCARNKGKIW